MAGQRRTAHDYGDRAGAARQLRLKIINEIKDTATIVTKADVAAVLAEVKTDTAGLPYKSG